MTLQKTALWINPCISHDFVHHFPWSGTIRSGVWMLLRSLILAFQKGSAHLYSQQQCRRQSVPPHPCQQILSIKQNLVFKMASKLICNSLIIRVVGKNCTPWLIKLLYFFGLLVCKRTLGPNLLPILLMQFSPFHSLSSCIEIVLII